MSEPTEKEFKSWLRKKGTHYDSDSPVEKAWAFLCERKRIPTVSRCCGIRAVGGATTCVRNEHDCWNEVYAEILLDVRDGVRKWVGNGMKFYEPPKQKKKNRIETVISGFK